MKAHQTIRGGLRRFTIAALLFAQVNLLFAAVLHHHEEQAGPAHTERHFCPAGDHLSPAASPEAFCVACQIVRHSVGCAGTGRFTPPRRALQPFRSSLAAGRALSLPHLASRGRAPPLS